MLYYEITQILDLDRLVVSEPHVLVIAGKNVRQSFKVWNNLFSCGPTFLGVDQSFDVLTNLFRCGPTFLSVDQSFYDRTNFFRYGPTFLGVRHF